MTINFSLFRPLRKEDMFLPKAEITRGLALNLRFIMENFEDDSMVCEYLFEATNAPDSMLDVEQKWIRDRFKLCGEYSISVGDVLMINNTAYLCKSIGWIKIENFTVNHDEN